MRMIACLLAAVVGAMLPLPTSAQAEASTDAALALGSFVYAPRKGCTLRRRLSTHRITVIIGTTFAADTSTTNTTITAADTTGNITNTTGITATTDSRDDVSLS